MARLSPPAQRLLGITAGRDARVAVRADGVPGRAREDDAAALLAACRLDVLDGGAVLSDEVSLCALCIVCAPGDTTVIAHCTSCLCDALLRAAVLTLFRAHGILRTARAPSGDRRTRSRL